MSVAGEMWLGEIIRANLPNEAFRTVIKYFRVIKWNRPTISLPCYNWMEKDWKFCCCWNILMFSLQSAATMYMETLKAVDPMMWKIRFIWNCTFLRSFRFTAIYGRECFRSWHLPIFSASFSIVFLQIIIILTSSSYS